MFVLNIVLDFSVIAQLSNKKWAKWNVCARIVKTDHSSQDDIYIRLLSNSQQKAESINQIIVDADLFAVVRYPTKW